VRADELGRNGSAFQSRVLSASTARERFARLLGHLVDHRDGEVARSGSRVVDTALEDSEYADDRPVR
jgi:hypothetical protein